MTLMNRDGFKMGKLVAIPSKDMQRKTVTTGQQTLGLTNERDALLYVPVNYNTEQPLPLAVMLHGAGGHADHGLWLLQSLADEWNLMLLAPPSRNGTWDIISNDRFGPDVLFINTAITTVLGQYAIDPKRIAIGGFSDGASYALSLGLINGDLFTHILAFSPGFYYAPQTTGKPNVYISHGTKDDILPINPCSRRIVPKLQKEGYDVVYREFDGPHILPAEISREAVSLFTKGAE